MTSIKNHYYQVTFNFLDTIALQMAGVALSAKDFYNVVLENFMTDQKQLLEVQKLSTKEAEDLGSWMTRDLFDSLSEIMNNQTAVPFIIFKILKYTKDCYGAEIIEEEKYYAQYLKAGLRDVLIATSPLPLKNFQKNISAFINDTDIIDQFLGETTDIDRQSKNIKLKAKIAVKPNEIDLSMLWFHSSINNQAIELLTERYGEELNPLFFRKPQGSINKLLLCNLTDVEFMKRITLFPEQLNYKCIVTSLMRFVLLLLENPDLLSNQTKETARLKEYFEKDVNALMAFLETKFSNKTTFMDFKKRISHVAKLNFNILEEKKVEVENMESEELKAVEEKRKKRLREIFEHKKERAMKKMDKLKSKFMVGLNKASDEFIKSLGKPEEAESLRCSVTQEKLSNEKTYIKLCYMTHFNVK